MQANSMYGNANQLQVYNAQQVAQQFTNWNFKLGDPWDRILPNIIQAIVNEIQGRAGTGHPIRLGMFNLISQNAYNNTDFQNAVQVIATRIALGVYHKEFSDINTAASTIIALGVKACGCAMAATDADFMRNLPEADARSAEENALVWNHLINLVNGHANFIPLSQLTSNTQFSSVNNATRDALAAAQGISGQVAGGFVENAAYAQGIAGGNNGGQSVGRYARRAETISGTLQGSMQTAIKKSFEPVGQVINEKEVMDAPRPFSRYNKGFTTISDATDVTDFTKSLGVSEPVVEEPVAAPVKPATIAVIDLGKGNLNVIRELDRANVKEWFSNKHQKHHPAWCKRTHTVRYFEIDDGTIIAVAQHLKDSEKEIAMDYNAHAIDPTKGHPDPEVPKAPVREEAKVLYKTEEVVNINVMFSEKLSMEEDVTSSVRSTRHTAELSSPVPEVYVRKSIINTPVIYEDSMEADDDQIVINAIANAPTFVDAAKLFSQLANPLVRSTLDRTLVDAINNVCVNELDIPIRISSFVEDVHLVIDAATDNFGILYGEKIKARQATILQANVICIPAKEAVDYANSALSVEGQDELAEETINKILFLSNNIIVAWTKYTDDELAIGVAPSGPAQIQKEIYPALYKVAKAVFDNVQENTAYTQFHLVTKDNVRYQLHRSLVSSDCFLISK